MVGRTHTLKWRVIATIKSFQEHSKHNNTFCNKKNDKVRDQLDQ
jgi:hypothetical protein